jgi:hypothetical protein
MSTIPNTQWQFLIITEDGDMAGTNDQKVAATASADNLVIWLPTSQIVAGTDEHGNLQTANIAEQTWYELG